MAVATGPRDLRDSQRLADLEVVIDGGMRSFVEVGDALLEIRASRLYRIGYETFEAYCKGRWQIGDRRARQLMDATEAIKTLPTGTTVPVNEAQARALAPVLREHGPEVAASVMAEASKAGPATAASIRAAVSPLRPRLDPAPDPYYVERAADPAPPRTVTAVVIDRPVEEPIDPVLWYDLGSVLDQIEALMSRDAADLAAAVPERRRPATARRIRKLGTFLGRIAWTLEGQKSPA